MNNEEIVEKFSKMFDDVDVSNKKCIDDKQFLGLYRKLMEDKTIEKTKSDLVFSGIDINETGVISKIEFMKLVKMKVYDDDFTKYKLIFRMFDNERAGSLSTDDIVKISDFVNKNITKREAEDLLFDETGSRDGRMTFPVFYKLMTNKDIDPKSDPYDGKLKPNSSCCALI